MERGVGERRGEDVGVIKIIFSHNEHRCNVDRWLAVV